MCDKDKFEEIVLCIICTLAVSLGYICAAGIGFLVATNGNKVLLGICIFIVFFTMQKRIRNTVSTTNDLYNIQLLREKLDEVHPILTTPTSELTINNTGVGIVEEFETDESALKINAYNVIVEYMRDNPKDTPREIGSFVRGVVNGTNQLINKGKEKNK